MIDAKDSSSFVNTVLAQLDHTPQTVLDLSPSLKTIELAKRLPQSHVVGLVLSYSSAKPIGVYQGNFENESIDNLNFIQGKPNSLPFEDGTFDTAILTTDLTDFLCSMEIWDQTLREMHRVLSIEGQAFLNIVLNLYTRPVDRRATDIDFEIDEIIALLNKMPFKNEVGIGRKKLNLEIAFKRIE